MHVATPSDPIAELYSQHNGWLQGWLRKKIGCPHNAADLAQDTFVRIIKARTASDIKEPRAYLDALLNQPESNVPSLEERAIIIESLLAIDTMLDKLLPKVRRAFLLSQLEGLSHVEITQRLDVSVSSVRQYLVKAVQHCLLFR